MFPLVFHPTFTKMWRSSIIIDHLLGKTYENLRDQVIFCYVSSPSSTPNSASTFVEDFLKSILAQLYAKIGLFKELKDLFAKKERCFPLHLTTKDYRSAVVEAMERLYLGGQARTTPGASAEPTNSSLRSCFLVIDGLDELTNSDLDGLLSILQELLKLGLSNLHVLVSSRWRNRINIVLDGQAAAREVEISEARIEADIIKYVNIQIETHYELSAKPRIVTDRIRDRLKQGGM